MKTRVIKIPANGSTGAMGFGGNYLRVEAASSSFYVRMANRAYVEIDKGIEIIAPEKWDQLEFENKTGAEITVTVVIGITDNFQMRSFRVVGDVTAEVSSGATLNSLPDVSCAAGAATQLVAAVATRKEVIISNLSTNTQTMRVGDSGAEVANGHPLAPGASVVFTSSDAVYAYNPGGAAESLAVVEVSQ